MNPLFQDEYFNVKKIYTVLYYDSHKEGLTGQVVHRETKLFSYELIYHLSGSNQLTYNGKKFDIGSNTLLYLPKGVDASEYVVDYKVPSVCIDIYFDTDSPMPADGFLMKISNTDIRSKFEKMNHIWASKAEGYYQQSMALMYEIVSTLIIGQHSYLGLGQSKALAAAMDYINQNYLNKDFDYAALAEMADLSYSYFKKLFVKKLGIPPVKYVTQLKINYAKELLVTRRYSVSQIAEMSGFGSNYYFSRVFKEVTGVSPQKYQGML